MCHGQKSLFWGDKLIPPLIGILISLVYKPLGDWVEFPIPYYMDEIMGVDRPDRTYILAGLSAVHSTHNHKPRKIAESYSAVGWCDQGIFFQNKQIELIP